MSDKPSGIWRRPFLRLVLPALALFITFLAVHWNRNPDDIGTGWLLGAICAVSITAAFWLAVFFVRWLCCWRNFRPLLIAAAWLAVLVAAFYLEENWRGKRAWENFKHKRLFQNPDLLGNIFDLFERKGLRGVCLSWLTSRRFSTICNASFFPR